MSFETFGEKNTPEEQINVSETGGRYQEIITFFKDMSVLDPARLEFVKQKGDESKINDFIEDKQKIETIISALENGDTVPAKAFLLSAIEANVEILKNWDKLQANEEVRKSGDSYEARLDNIRMLTGYVGKLEGVQTQEVKHGN